MDFGEKLWFLVSILYCIFWDFTQCIFLSSLVHFLWFLYRGEFSTTYSIYSCFNRPARFPDLKPKQNCYYNKKGDSVPFRPPPTRPLKPLDTIVDAVSRPKTATRINNASIGLRCRGRLVLSVNVFIVLPPKPAVAPTLRTMVKSVNVLWILNVHE